MLRPTATVLQDRRQGMPARALEMAAFAPQLPVAKLLSEQTSLRPVGRTDPYQPLWETPYIRPGAADRLYGWMESLLIQNRVRSLCPSQMKNEDS
jgi:hypothetical protein